MSRPLGDVLLHAIPDFTPEHPDRSPWQREQLDRVQHAHTGNVAVVRLERAGHVELHGLERTSYEQDPDCPEDWTRQSWGV